MTERRVSPFNSPFETGVRALAVLFAAHPRAHDLHRLVQYDYLTVHSEDAGGPPSLHPPLPLRSNELLVRRDLVERGVMLMASAALVSRAPQPLGFLYSADESAGPFIANLQSEYLTGVKQRAQWVVDTFDHLTAEELNSFTNRLFEAWTTEFQPVEMGAQLELPT
ncbi:MAG: threonine transporter [Woeseia sp.]